MGFDTTAITARLIRVELDTGETEILITSLTIDPAVKYCDKRHI